MCINNESHMFVDASRKIPFKWNPSLTVNRYKIPFEGPVCIRYENSTHYRLRFTSDEDRCKHPISPPDSSTPMITFEMHPVRRGLYHTMKRIRKSAKLADDDMKKKPKCRVERKRNKDNCDLPTTTEKPVVVRTPAENPHPYNNIMEGFEIAMVIILILIGMGCLCYDCSTEGARIIDAVEDEDPEWIELDMLN